MENLNEWDVKLWTGFIYTKNKDWWAFACMVMSLEIHNVWHIYLPAEQLLASGGFPSSLLTELSATFLECKSFLRQAVSIKRHSDTNLTFK